jgi:hypothetical protein
MKSSENCRYTIDIILALLTHLCSYAWKKKVEYQYRIKAGELKFMRWTTKYIGKHY